MELLHGVNLANKLPKEALKVFDKDPVKRSPAEGALRWVWNHPAVVTVLSGMNTMEMLEENIRIAYEAKPNELT